MVDKKWGDTKDNHHVEDCEFCGRLTSLMSFPGSGGIAHNIRNHRACQECFEDYRQVLGSWGGDGDTAQRVGEEWAKRRGVRL